jgi:hypothetical protein
VASVGPMARPGDTFDLDGHERSCTLSGHNGPSGTTTPLGAALVLSAFPRELRLAMPVVVQRPPLAALATVARLRGYPPVARPR